MKKINSLSKQKYVLRKCCGIPQKWWMLELYTFCHCVKYPWKFTSRDFWFSRNERKPLSKQKCVLRKCCRVLLKWWMLELSTLCNCIQHPWKLTCWYFWSSRNKRKPLSKQKYVLRKCCGISQKQWMPVLSTLCHCLQTSLSWKLTYSDSGALGTEENNFLSKNVFWGKCCGLPQKWWMLELSSLWQCVEYPLKLNSGFYWSSRNKRNLLSK